MAYPNEHLATIKNPAGARLSRTNNALGDGVHTITEPNGDLQAVLFDKRIFSLAQARKWLSTSEHTALSVASAEKGINLLTFDSDPASLAFAAVSGVTEIDELPTQSFIKDLIQVGVYRHPQDGWELNVTPEKMDQWIMASQQMEANGVTANVVKDHSFRSDDALGTLTGLFRKPNDKGVMTLFGIHTMVGQDSIELAQKIGQVSIWLEPSFTDGKGRSYGEAIIHSSVTPQPVVPDQQGFVAIAASTGRRAMAASLKRLSNDRPGDKTMDLKKWLAMLGLTEADGVTEENLLDKVTSHVTALSTKHTEDMQTQKTQVDTLTTEVTELKARVASMGDPPKVDADAIEMLAEGVETGIAGLVETGKLTPKAASRIALLLAGTDKARPAMLLSRTANGGSTPLAKSLIEALKDNTPVDLKVHTGAQVLSRQTPGNDTSAVADKGVVDNMLGGASGGSETVL